MRRQSPGALAGGLPPIYSRLVDAGLVSVSVRSTHECESDIRVLVNAFRLVRLGVSPVPCPPRHRAPSGRDIAKTKKLNQKYE